MICINRRCQREIPDGSAFCSYCGRKQEAAPKRRGKRPNGAGSVYKRSGNRSRPWVVARNHVILSYHATKAEAFIELDKLAGKPVSDKVNFTFAEVYASWMPEHSLTVTKKGMEGYTTAYKWCEPLHKKKFRMLRTADYQQIINDMAAAGRSKSLMEKVKQLVGQLYKWAVREDVTSKSYASFIIIPETESKEKVIFTDAQIAALEADASDEARIVLMLIYTGVRINELFSATVANYHGTYYITGSKTEAGRNRVVPIPKVARPHFEYFAATATGKLLDGYTGNKDANNFRKREFDILMKRLGIEGVTPHCTRHTYASHAVSIGMRAEVLQKILGHANYSTTAEIYVHTDAEELVAAAENAW